MSWQRIELNMIPDTKVLPVVHASQFDSNRSISFQMFTGEDEWTIPEGLTIELHCRKVDDNIVTLAPLSVDGSVITFITTEQLTACSGQNKCELSFINSDELVIGSLNFILDVEPDPLKGGLTSASSIYDLTQQIEDIAQEVIGDDYYNKTEVDTLLADKANVSDIPDMSLYYTKSQSDTLLNAKADKSDTYTKDQVDTALAAKANSADLATVATSGDYDDIINKPTIPAAQVQSDWTQSDSSAPDYIKNKPSMPSAQIQSDWAQTNIAEVDYIKNKPNLSTVATSGSYNDLSDKPVIPTVPTDLSAFNNDVGYITINDVPPQEQSDWAESDSTKVDYIKNKPTLSTVATSGSYNDLSDKPTIPAAQINSDWNAVSGVAQILNKPSLAAVATSGDYDDLSNKPTIPVVPTNVSSFTNDVPYATTSQIPNVPIESISVNGTAQTITNKNVDISVPTETSDLTNDSGFITINDVPAQEQANWSQTNISAVDYIKNKPSTDQWTFTIDDGQGGTTTVTKNVYIG
jgi:hypothetical protein